MNLQDFASSLGFDDQDPQHRLSLSLAQATSDLVRQLVLRRHSQGISVAQLSKTLGVEEAAVLEFESDSGDASLSQVRLYSLAVAAQLSFTVRDVGEAGFEETPSPAGLRAEVAHKSDSSGVRLRDGEQVAGLKLDFYDRKRQLKNVTFVRLSSDERSLGALDDIIIDSNVMLFPSRKSHTHSNKPGNAWKVRTS